MSDDESTNDANGNGDDLLEGEIHDDVIPSENAEEFVSMVMTRKEAREKFLGKMAEFELLLLSCTELQRQFILAYLADPTNAAQAARTAGYSVDSADKYARKLLRTDKILAAIALGSQLREDRTMITSERTLHELAIIAFSDITDFVADTETNEITTREGVPDYATKAIASAKYETRTLTKDNGDEITTRKVEIRLWPKTDALRMLAMYQKLLSGGLENTTINVNQDNRGQTHVHNHQHNTWQWGDKTLTF